MKISPVKPGHFFLYWERRLSSRHAGWKTGVPSFNRKWEADISLSALL